MCVAAFKQLHWQRDNQAAAQEAYNNGASDYQGFQFFDQSNPRKSLYDKGFTMLAPARVGVTPTVVTDNKNGTKTFASGVSSAFNPVASSGGANRVIS